MSDPSFEQELGRLFAEPPPLTSHADFTLAVKARLDRGWAMRRVLIGAAGVVGGLVAAGQVVGANLVQRAAMASQGADNRVHDVAADLLARGEATLHLQSLPLGGEVLWMVAGLAAMGVALLAARLMEAL
ncbi:hypothetical protein [Caulobacter sp. S45]|uniref:hypothetical protein n=1 Tax=Caulobacter sp. S45 TaxID=1641861 RepID=UPI0015775CA0|nr:hypothetical protein [Caulobacter sp. S45]